MNFKNVKTVNKQILLELSLALFTEYRSAKIKGNEEIIFWNNKKTIFNTRNIISFNDLVFRYIPIQLSYCKWRTDTKQQIYLDEINKVFSLNISDNEKLNKFNNWFSNELNNTLIIDLSDELLEEKLIIINKLNRTERAKNKGILSKINVKDDIISSYVERVKSFDRKKTIDITKNLFKAAVLALFIKFNIMFTPLAERDVYISEVLDKKEDLTEQLITEKVIHCNNIITKSIDMKNRFKFFDSS